MWQQHSKINIINIEYNYWIASLIEPYAGKQTNLGLEYGLE